MASIWTIPMRPFPSDGLDTSTSAEQLTTEQTLLRTLTTSPPSPPKTLNKAAHTQYIAKSLMSLPAPYVTLDASRPWLMYWCLHGFDLLGVGLDETMKKKAAETILSFQSPSGGFCGGPPPAHMAHLLPNYASVMVLAICGTKEDWSKIDRKGMYEFFMRCKLPDGGFIVSEDGEVDVRGVYCLLVCATLLDILTPELVHNTDKFLAGCQTYEGGFASSSFSLGPGLPMPAMAEAHGGYTSCALHSYFLLRPIYAATAQHQQAPIDTDAALRWVVTMQAASIEGGGFKGRTNKLVDGCYGWWVGGLGAVLDALVRVNPEKEKRLEKGNSSGSALEEVEEDWVDDLEEPDMLTNRIALQEYILLAAQSDKGGLRDKPGKSPDLYHTTNNLSGLSAAQHVVRHSPSRISALKSQWKPFPAPGWLIDSQKEAGISETEEDRNARRREVWADALGWVEDEGKFHSVGGEVNRVNTTCPVFNILLLRVKPFINHFYGQE